MSSWLALPRWEVPSSTAQQQHNSRLPALQCACVSTHQSANRPQHSSAALAACKLHSTLCAMATLYTPPLITTEKGTCKHRALYTAYQPTRACSTMRPTDLARSTGKEKIPITMLQSSGCGSHRQQHSPSSCLKGIYHQHTCLLA